VLPWGQMSFWGATVITNLFTVIPFAGEDVAYWLWGGFSIGNATLTRFFSFHFTLPFVLAAVVCVHLAVLHQAGSTSVFGVVKHADKIFFYPYFYVKDYVGVLAVGLVFLSIVTYQPDMLISFRNGIFYRITLYCGQSQINWLEWLLWPYQFVCA
jgi:ubiquinol-cytochrome c reductase cytochrome b subunit